MESGNLVSKEKEEKNLLKSKDILNNLKSDYFLQKLFNFLQTKILLNIVKYNKNKQKRINININDYKEYSEKYSSIEIEIKPVNNKYGQFIKIKKEYKKYYHIYFDNDEEDRTKNYVDEFEPINIIKIIIDYNVESFEYLFYECECIESIVFKKFYRNNIKNMSQMFDECSSFK